MNSTSVCLLALTLAQASPEVHTDYFTAYTEARDHKLLLIDFGSGFDLDRLDPRQLDDYVVCRVPADYEIELDGQSRRLLAFGAFRALEGQPGLAIVDLKHRDRPGIYKRTVSVLPRRHATPGKVSALLDLPPGTLTQRTLTWALRIHPERPQSVYAAPDPQLIAHCRRHCGVQCAANDQHHASAMPGRCEIVAESWPWNRNVVDAAIDIVQAWRGSPSHWSAAAGRWHAYGYDMQTNGRKWFATGVFR